MRLGVLDIGSNSANLRVVDVYPGSPPLPVYRHTTATRLAESIGPDGTIDPPGVARLVDAVRAAVARARRQQVVELIPFATSAVRDAANRDQILRAINVDARLDVGFLSGEDEARLTYFAAHRWYGWSTGPLLMLDIGGGSMEVAQGRDEDPALAISLPLGAGRLTRSHLPEHPADRVQLKPLREHIREVLTPAVQRLQWESQPRRAVATSKTFKQLARFAGEPDPSGSGGRVLERRELKAWVPRLAAMTPAQRAELPGVTPARARQLLAGAVVAATTMTALGLDRVHICPWALREGILLRRMAPLPSPEALRQVQLIQAIGAGVTSLAEHRLERRSR
jgi:exopolyphosphatase / guanosine-5'-triphosphate,3'-diphosphate pyrophosphatase